MNRRFDLRVASWAVLLFGSIFTLSSAVEAKDPATDPAVEQARSWLGLVDGERYASSWDEAATLFQKAVKKEQWEQQVKGARAPLGKLKSRELMAAKPATSLPGAPDGEYVVIQFKSSFENKKEAIETITPMKDGGRGWRVSGYYIK